jgi:anti-sigma regulatory factor (Ser/Thr protein kinase)
LYGEGSKDVAAFAATLLRGPIDLREMRHLLTSWLELTDAKADVRDAVLLATHEAAANAMAHGQPKSPVSISASQDQAGGFTIEVTNLGAWKEPELGHDGRGLVVMNELMSEVAIQTRVRMLRA